MSNGIRKSPVVFLLCLMCAAATCLSPVFAAEDDVLGRADNAFREGNCEVAKPLYQQLYNEYGANNTTPGRRALNCYLLTQFGQCCKKLGQLGEARDWFELVIKLFPDDRDVCAGAQYELGRVYARMGLKDLARQELEKVITTYPDDDGTCAYALLAKAKIDMRPGRYSLAVETLERLIDGYSDKRKLYKDAKRMLVDALDNDLRINDALELLDDMLAGDEFDVEEKGELMVVKANVQLRASRISDSEATCKTILDEYGESNMLRVRAKWAQIQIVCLTGEDPDTGLRLIADVTDLPWYSREPSRRAQLALWKGSCHMSMGDFVKAEECFTDIIKTFPELHEVVGDSYLHLARLHIRTKEYETASADIDKISTSYLRHFARGEWHYCQGKLELAAEEFEQSLAALPAQRVSNVEPLGALRRLVACYSRLGLQAEQNATQARLKEFESTHM